jgi:hypothetical protein
MARMEYGVYDALEEGDYDTDEDDDVDPEECCRLLDGLD